MYVFRCGGWARCEPLLTELPSHARISRMVRTIVSSFVVALLVGISTAVSLGSPWPANQAGAQEPQELRQPEEPKAVSETVPTSSSWLCRSPAPHDFTDVREGSFYDIAVGWLLEAGITSGTGSGRFSPSRTVTRGEMATFLWRFAGSPVPEGSHGFSDVVAGKYYENAVTWLIESGITAGTSPGVYSPAGLLTRGQMAVYLWKSSCGSPREAELGDLTMTKAPTVMGTPLPGETLTLDPGAWTSDSEPNVNLQAAIFVCDDSACERVTGSQPTTTYIAQVADIGKSLEGRVIASAGTKTGEATSARLPIVDTNKVSQEECGSYVDVVWTADVIHDVTCRISVYGSLAVEPGTIVRVGCEGGFEVVDQMHLSGAVLTRRDDPEFMAPSGPDDCSDEIASEDYGRTIIRQRTSKVMIENSYVQGAVITTDEDRAAGATVEVAQSTVEQSIVDTDGAVVRFTSSSLPGTRLLLKQAGPGSEVSNNQFFGIGMPVVMLNGLSAIDLTSDSSGNRFGAGPSENAVTLSGGYNGDDEWSAPRLVVHLGSLSVGKNAELTIKNGVTVKRSCASKGDRSFMVLGKLSVSNANLTYAGDDSVGGDTNGEGGLCGLPLDREQTWAIYLRGGSLVLEDSLVRHGEFHGDAPSITVTGSDIQQTTIHPEATTYIVDGNEFVESKLDALGPDEDSTITANSFRGKVNPLRVDGNLRIVDLTDTPTGNEFIGSEADRTVRFTGGIYGDVEWNGGGGAIVKLYPSSVSVNSTLTLKNGADARFSCGYGGIYKLQVRGQISVIDSSFGANPTDASSGGECVDSAGDANQAKVLMVGEGTGFSAVGSQVDNIHFDGERWEGTTMTFIDSAVSFDTIEMLRGLVTFVNNDVYHSQLDLDSVASSSRISGSDFTSMVRPLFLTSISVGILDLSSETGNVFDGPGAGREVLIRSSSIPDSFEWQVDGSTGAVVTTKTTLEGQGSGSVRLTNGAIIAAPPGIDMFRLGLGGTFRAEGTNAEPVVFTSTYDLPVVGNVEHNIYDPELKKFGSVIEHGPDNPVIAAISTFLPGNEPLASGPGIVDINNAVVRYADEGFFQCSVCSMNVNETDFYSVDEAAVAAYVWLGQLPCTPVNGALLTAESLSLGLGGVGFRTDMNGNFWGAAGGPKARVSLSDLLGFREDASGDALAVLDALDPESEAYSELSAYLSTFEGDPPGETAVPEGAGSALSLIHI